MKHPAWIRRIVIFSLCLAGIAGCASDTPDPSPDTTESVTPDVTLSPSPAAQATPVPTSTPEPTPSPAPSPALSYIPEPSDLRTAAEMTPLPVYSGALDQFPASLELPEGVLSVKLKDGYGTQDSDGVEVLRDVKYDERDGEELSLQILLPSGREEGVLLPLIVYIPGSAWMRQNVHMAIPQMTRVAAQGYAVAIVEYRGTDLAYFPAQTEDAKTAKRFLRKNAGEYGIDPEKAAIWGDSSGGHTSVMAGITGDGLLDNKTYGEYSSKVTCIVDWYGPTDIALMGYYPSMLDHNAPFSPEGLLIGGKTVRDNPELAEKANPMHYISEEADIPPMLIMHGSKDTLVPFNQSVRLYESLRAANKTVEMIKLEDGQHGSGGFAGDEALAYVLDFIARQFDALG